MLNKLILIAVCLFSQLAYSKFNTEVEAVIPEILHGYPNLRDYTLNQAQNEAYFTAQSVLGEISVIMRMDKKNGKWGKAQIASFSGQHHDLEAFLSHDGLKLYFASKRPNSSAKEDNYDIWFVKRENQKSQWSEAINMGPQINSKHNEFYPSIAKNNNFYFTSNKEDSKGKDDIYFSEFKGGEYKQSFSISQSVNTDGDEYNAFISADDSYLIFGAYRRADSIGSGDLYISYKNQDGSWSPALRLPEPINSKQMDYCPFVIGNTLYFTSRRSEFNPKEFVPKNSKELIKQLNKNKNGLSRIYKTSLKNSLPAYQSHLFPAFLIGKWKVKGKQTYEQWNKDGDSNLIGSSYKVKDGKSITTETIKIIKKNNDWTYSATVLDQNQGKTIDFDLNNKVYDKYDFVNMDHDFPNTISYEKKSDNHLFVRVSDKMGNGFSYDMFKQIEKKKIPQWFMAELEKNIGTWTADNSAYKSDKEKQEQYELHWQWGIGKTSITGKLYGYIDGEKTQDYWHYRLYWDNQTSKALLVQYGNAGIYGIGEINQIDEDQSEIIQTFSDPNSKSWKTKHTSRYDGKAHYNSSFKQTPDGSWELDRNYIWYKSDE